MSSLKSELEFIRKQIPESDLHVELSANLSSHVEGHRLKIRELIKSKYASMFSDADLEKVTDLTSRPFCDKGYFSISHCQSLGGFAYSKIPMGFDVECSMRISMNVINRTSSRDEINAAPDAHFLWVAKESAFKSLSSAHENLVMSDLVCHSWESYNETQSFGFRIKSQKTLALNLNRGFVFSEKDTLVAIFFT